MAKELVMEAKPIILSRLPKYTPLSRYGTRLAINEPQGGPEDAPNSKYRL